VKRKLNGFVAGVSGAVNGFGPAFRNAWRAAAQVQDGEFLPVWRKVEALDGVRSAGAAASPVADPREERVTRADARRKRVVLAVGDRLHANVADYALDVCERMGADLEILARCDAKPIESMLRGLMPSHRSAVVRVDVIGSQPDVLRAVRRYVATHAGVLFVVASALEGFEAAIAVDRAGRGDCSCSVPWVMVAGAMTERAPIRVAAGV
jgi:hypothetical protein